MTPSHWLVTAGSGSLGGRVVILPRSRRDIRDLLSLTLIPEMFPKTIIQRKKRWYQGTLPAFSV